jgi:hypothetical protein
MQVFFLSFSLFNPTCRNYFFILCDQLALALEWPLISIFLKKRYSLSLGAIIIIYYWNSCLLDLYYYATSNTQQQRCSMLTLRSYVGSKSQWTVAEWKRVGFTPSLCQYWMFNEADEICWFIHNCLPLNIHHAIGVAQFICCG